METEIKVKKPKVIKFFGIATAYQRYTNRWWKWKLLMPKNGDKIKITWLPSCRNVPNGTPNPYIGMEGVVENMTIDGDFYLNCETCGLVCTGEDFSYIKL